MASILLVVFFSPSASVQADIQAARQEALETQATSVLARQQLAALADKRREEEGAAAEAGQRAATLAREESELRATAIAARLQGGEGREAAAAARGELAELREAADRERRALEAFRDKVVTLEAAIARKKEQDRFTREAADAQQARLDEIKREVGFSVHEWFRGLCSCRVAVWRDRWFGVFWSLWRKNDVHDVMDRRVEGTRC